MYAPSQGACSFLLQVYHLMLEVQPPMMVDSLQNYNCLQQANCRQKRQDLVCFVVLVGCFFFLFFFHNIDIYILSESCWDAVSFLHTSLCGAGLCICGINSTEKTAMFWLLLSSDCTASRLSPQKRPGWEWAGGCEREAAKGISHTT